MEAGRNWPDCPSSPRGGEKPWVWSIWAAGLSGEMGLRLVDPPFSEEGWAGSSCPSERGSEVVAWVVLSRAVAAQPLGLGPEGGGRGSGRGGGGGDGGPV